MNGYNDINDFKIKINEYEGTLTICGFTKKMTRLHTVNIAPTYEFFGRKYKVTALDNKPICDKFTKEINIPSTVTKIGLHAFDGMSNLSKINVAKENEKYRSVNGVLFNKSGTILIKFPIKAQFQEYEIPNTVRTIKENAFQNSYTIKKITMSDKVNSIGAMAFQNCKFLTEIKLSDKIDKFDRRLFDGCCSLAKINTPSNLTKIAAYVFANCTSLNFNMPSSIDSLGMGAFGGSGISSFCLSKESKINFLHKLTLVNTDLDLFYVDTNTLYTSESTAITGGVKNFVIGKNFDCNEDNLMKLFGSIYTSVEIENLFIFCEQDEFKHIAPSITGIYDLKNINQIYLENIQNLENKGFDYGQINQILKGYEKGILLNALPINTDINMMRSIISVFEKDKSTAFNIINDINSAERTLNPFDKAEIYGNINKIISETLSGETERSER